MERKFRIKLPEKSKTSKVDIEDLFKRIVKKESPEAHYWYYPTSGFHIIDLPRERKLHGSSVAFRCNEKCESTGDIVTYDDPKIVEGIMEFFKNLNCEIIGTHTHGLLYPEAHIHINCKNLTEENVKKIMELIRWF